MEIKIKGRNKELFNANLSKALNIGQVAASGGRLDATHEDEKWQLAEPDKFDLLPVVNNYKAFVRGRGENEIALEFYYRYDTAENRFAVALTHLVAAVLREDAEIINQ